MSKTKLVITESAQPGELVRISPEFFSHPRCAPFASLVCSGFESMDSSVLTHVDEQQGRLVRPMEKLGGWYVAFPGVSEEQVISL